MASSMQVNDVPPTATQKVAWYDVLGKWRQAVADFDSQLALVQSQAATASSLRSVHPALYAQYATLMKQVPAVQARISDVDAAIADVESWLSGAWNEVKGAWTYVQTSVTSLFGLSGLGCQARGLRGLGQWQLIPLAVVAAGAAYVAAKAMDLYNLNTKLAAVKAYEAKGMSPAAAAALVAKTSATPGIFSGISSSLQYAAIALVAGGALLFFMRRKP